MNGPYGGGRFRDRDDAGVQLGAALASVVAERAELPTLLLGLPRGGVVVAAAAAGRLGCGFDAIGVRKIGAPGNPELALGAVTADGAVLINDEVARAEGLSDAQVQARTADAAAEAAAAERRYRGEAPRPDLAGHQVVICDDGAATGATVRAAIRSARSAGAARVVVGLPVAPRETLAVLELEADAVVCLRRPLLFRAVGWAYDDFAPTPTEHVVALLEGPGGAPR